MHVQWSFCSSCGVAEKKLVSRRHLLPTRITSFVWLRSFVWITDKLAFLVRMNSNKRHWLSHINRSVFAIAWETLIFDARRYAGRLQSTQLRILLVRKGEMCESLWNRKGRWEEMSIFVSWYSSLSLLSLLFDSWTKTSLIFSQRAAEIKKFHWKISPIRSRKASDWRETFRVFVDSI